MWVFRVQIVMWKKGRFREEYGEIWLCSKRNVEGLCRVQ